MYIVDVFLKIKSVLYEYICRKVPHIIFINSIKFYAIFITSEFLYSSEFSSYLINSHFQALFRSV